MIDGRDVRAGHVAHGTHDANAEGSPHRSGPAEYQPQFAIDRRPPGESHHPDAHGQRSKPLDCPDVHAVGCLLAHHEGEADQETREDQNSESPAVGDPDTPALGTQRDHAGADDHHDDGQPLRRVQLFVQEANGDDRGEDGRQGLSRRRTRHLLESHHVEEERQANGPQQTARQGPWNARATVEAHSGDDHEEKPSRDRELEQAEDYVEADEAGKEALQEPLVEYRHYGEHEATSQGGDKPGHRGLTPERTIEQRGIDAGALACSVHATRWAIANVPASLPATPVVGPHLSSPLAARCSPPLGVG